MGIRKTLGKEVVVPHDLRYHISCTGSIWIDTESEWQRLASHYMFTWDELKQNVKCREHCFSEFGYISGSNFRASKWVNRRVILKAVMKLSLLNKTKCFSWDQLCLWECSIHHCNGLFVAYKPFQSHSLLTHILPPSAFPVISSIHLS
jgi:hypothetical protein